MGHGTDGTDGTQGTDDRSQATALDGAGVAGPGDGLEAPAPAPAAVAEVGASGEAALTPRDVAMLDEKYALLARPAGELSAVESAFVEVLKANLHKDLMALLGTAKHLIGLNMGLGQALDSVRQQGQHAVDLLAALAQQKGGILHISAASVAAVPKGTQIEFKAAEDQKTGKTYHVVGLRYVAGGPRPALLLPGPGSLPMGEMLAKARRGFRPPR